MQQPPYRSTCLTWLAELSAQDVWGVLLALFTGNYKQRKSQKQALGCNKERKKHVCAAALQQQSKTPKQHLSQIVAIVKYPKSGCLQLLGEDNPQ